MTDEVLAEQARYYRRRAHEYDATSYGDVVAARARIVRLVGDMQPTGTILEIACGTGVWTQALADAADTLIAIDAAPEVIAIARDRVMASNVRFEVADIFSWKTPQRFDVIFFSAWLSHVPMNRFDEFWQMLRDLLAERGRVLFVDEPIELRDKETYLSDSDEIVQRQLRHGTTFHLVKNFIDPDVLAHRLRGLGWDCRTWRDDDGDWTWICGEAQPMTE
ncbi:MAG TPA: class I SAM-dependent methyltransferase [Jatrophihabitantaceae bacterium]|nr:class I SAM-dependent methyltransferase [Jatrophihabitantaceae bacterium]